MSRGSLNKVMLIGNLGADPETRYTPSNMAITKIRIATSESWKDKNTGEPQERTEWHRVTLFGKLGEIAQQYLRKGSKVYIEGQLRTNKWQGPDGQDRYSTDIVVDMKGSMMMLDGRPGGRRASSCCLSCRQRCPWSSGPGRRGPATCWCATGLRCRPWSPCGGIAGRSRRACRRG